VAVIHLLLALVLLERMSVSPLKRSSTEDAWNIHQETLRRLYLTENRSLKDVRHIMEETHNFKAS
jgi:Clr5 domain